MRPFRNCGKWNISSSSQRVISPILLINQTPSLIFEGRNLCLFILFLCIAHPDSDCALKHPVCIQGCSCSLCIYCFVDTLVWPRAKQPHQHVFYDGMVGRVSHSARQRNQWWIYTRPGTLLLHNMDCQSSLHWDLHFYNMAVGRPEFPLKQ